jgi:hypothetical protein
MNTGARPPSPEDDLKHLSPDALIARILELQSQNQQLAQRIGQLEELFRLAQLKRFAPSSEKLKDRVFDEAEQIAATEPADDDPDDAFALPDTGLPEVDNPSAANRDASRCQRSCRAGASSTTCPTSRRFARAVRTRCTAWASK